MKTDISVERVELKEVWRINICSMAKYNQNEGYIDVQFTDSIMPYLAQTRRKFVLYNLKEIANFLYSQGFRNDDITESKNFFLMFCKFGN
jgi:plasmid replication initiation protein